LFSITSELPTNRQSQSAVSPKQESEAVSGETRCSGITFDGSMILFENVVEVLYWSVDQLRTKRGHAKASSQIPRV
jgi:hypothetical protein